MTDYVYDIETFFNCFTVVIFSAEDDRSWVFEVSPYRNDWREFVRWVKTRMDEGNCRMVGFNNVGFDYPVIHELLTHYGGKADAETVYRAAYLHAQKIINTPYEKRWFNIINTKDVLLPQLDLYLIHHFDNSARATSLKELEFNMRSKNIGDLPYSPDTRLTRGEVRELIDYNIQDVQDTYDFYVLSSNQIRFRDELSEKYGRDFTNHNDTKIGKDYFIMELEAKLGKTACYQWKDGKRTVRQTKRDSIKLADAVFPYVEFKHPEFQAVADWFRQQTITETKGVFSDIPEHRLGNLNHYAEKVTKRKTFKSPNDPNLAKLAKQFPDGWIEHRILKSKQPRWDFKRKEASTLNTVFNGLRYDFGTGGLHASVESTTVRSDDKYIIIDLDVLSYYPSLAIVNRLYPAHLGQEFCDIYADVKRQRVSYPKGTTENAMLKLALNGVYGDSNNKYSPFYDPLYTMKVTLNGQLLLCKLVEYLSDIDDLQVIQANTDGVTVKLPRLSLDEMQGVIDDWELLTGLELERADYSAMYIRDVNNYIAVTTDGKVKRKGAYEYDLDWSKNFSALVIQKAVSAHLLDGVPVRQFIENHNDPYDFLLRAKVPRTSRLVMRTASGDEPMQKITRYYISKTGGSLIKIMPPTPIKPGVWRHIGVNSSELVTEVNHYTGEHLNNIDLNYYIEEANKMIEPLKEAA